MSSLTSHRTPISILQEVCVKKAISPIYELVSSEGPIHEPYYVFLCSAGPFSTKSKGTSKKRAKHLASYMILLKMMNSNFLTESEKLILRDVHISASNVLGPDALDTLENLELEGIPTFMRQHQKSDEDENYVGQLQELCQKNMWPPPVYTFASPSNFGRSTNDYCCKVSLWKWNQTGLGNSKKTAKRRAAFGMLESINKNNLVIPQDALDRMEEENLQPDDQNATSTKFESDASVRIASRAVRGVWKSDGEKLKIPYPVETNALENPCEYLDNFIGCTKLSILYTYMIDNTTGKTYCLAKLSTVPPHIVKSQGFNDLTSARNDAARRMIWFLGAMSIMKPNINYNEWFWANY